MSSWSLFFFSHFNSILSITPPFQFVFILQYILCLYLLIWNMKVGFFDRNVASVANLPKDLPFVAAPAVLRCILVVRQCLMKWISWLTNIPWLSNHLWQSWAVFQALSVRCAKRRGLARFIAAWLVVIIFMQSVQKIWLMGFISMALGLLKNLTSSGLQPGLHLRPYLELLEDWLKELEKALGKHSLVTLGIVEAEVSRFKSREIGRNDGQLEKGECVQRFGYSGTSENKAGMLVAC